MYNCEAWQMPRPVNWTVAQMSQGGRGWWNASPGAGECEHGHGGTPWVRRSSGCSQKMGIESIEP